MANLTRCLLDDPYASPQVCFTGFDPGEVPLGRMYGSNFSVKRSFFARHGGFDEDFCEPAYDDTELEIRFRQSGFRMIYESRARVQHYHPHDLRTYAARMRMVGRNAMRLYREHPQSMTLTDLGTLLTLPRAGGGAGRTHPSREAISWSSSTMRAGIPSSAY
jgi:GT2 family glycosyltransferase